MEFPKDDYIIFDFETTGLNPLRDHVIQMTAMRVRKRRKKVLNLYIKTDITIPQVVSDIHGITNEFLNENGRDPKEAWERFQAFTNGLPLVGHNSINFDKKFLQAAYSFHGFEWPNDDLYFDTAMLYKAKKLKERCREFESHYSFCKRVGAIRAFGVKFKLTIACEEMGIDISKFTAHQSDSDVEMTHLLYLKHLESSFI